MRMSLVQLIAYYPLVVLLFILGTDRGSALRKDPPSFIAQHVLCSDEKVKDLINFTKRASCEDFLANEVIVTPLSQEHYTQPQYHQLAANLIAAVKRGVLRIGLSGGSITNMCTRSFKIRIDRIFGGFGTNNNGQQGSPGTLVQVMDGAISGTGALIPAGCPTNLLGDTNLDVIIVEFAANDHSEQHLRSLVRVLQKTYRSSALVIMELTTLQARYPRPRPWLAAGIITKEFNLPFVNWSTVVDIGFNKTFNPNRLWSDTVHPTVPGVVWISLSMVETLEAVYRHNVAAVAQGSRALQSLQLPDHKARADVSSQVCVTDYCSGGYPRESPDAESKARTSFEGHVFSGDCWKTLRHHHGGGEDCFFTARHFNASQCRADGTSREIRFDVTVNTPCQLAVALVGNGHTNPPVQCNMNVLDNGKPHSVVHAKYLFLFSQTVVKLSALEPGAHVVTLVPYAAEAPKNGRTRIVGADQEEVCNVAALMCIPT